VPRDPIRPNSLWLFVHSGGEGRETHAVFKSLKVRATRIISQAAQPTLIRQTPATPVPTNPKGFLESLLDAL
jgi:hypothetical protein